MEAPREVVVLAFLRRAESDHAVPSVADGQRILLAHLHLNVHRETAPVLEALRQLVHLVGQVAFGYLAFVVHCFLGVVLRFHRAVGEHLPYSDQAVAALIELLHFVQRGISKHLQRPIQPQHSPAATQVNERVGVAGIVVDLDSELSVLQLGEVLVLLPPHHGPPIAEIDGPRGEGSGTEQQGFRGVEVDFGEGGQSQQAVGEGDGGDAGGADASPDVLFVDVLGEVEDISRAGIEVVFAGLCQI